MIDVNKAKQKILDMAIRGKLTKQLKSDGNAEDLFIEIQKEKEKLLKEERKRNDKSIISESIEEPFEIPENWKWCRLGELTDIERGGSPRPIKSFITFNEDGTNWIKIGDVEKNGKYITKTKEKIIKDGERHSRKVKPGDFLLTNSMSFGRPYISKIEGCIHDGWLVIRGNNHIYISDYLYYYLSSQFAYDQFCESASGATVDNLSIDKVKNSLLAIPPLAEQKRIVEKVEVLFDLLDKIDESQKKYQKDKEILKTKIIESGIRGKLTKQLKSDGDAKDLYDKIQKEKEKLIKEGKIKRDKKETYIYKNPKDNLYYEKYQDGKEKCIQDELPFDIPENWVWCRASQLLYLIAGTSYNKADIKSDGIRILRGGNIVANQIVLFEDDVFVSDSYQDEVKNVYKGDIILVASTGSKITIGKPARILGNYHKTQIGAFLRIARMYKNSISNYIWYIFNSSYYKNHILENVKGTNISNIKNEYIEDMLIPFPPFAEQERIVEQIEELLISIVS